MTDLLEKDKSRLEIKTLLDGYSSLKKILQNIKQVVWVLDLNTDQMLYVSPAFENVWGRSCESLYADPLILIKSVHPEDRVKVLSASPDDNRVSLNQSYRIFRPDGSLRWISAQTFLIDDQTPEPVNTQSSMLQVNVAEDITDQSQVDQIFHKALDRSREQFTLSRRMSLAHNPEAVLKTLMAASELRTAKRAFVLFFETALVGHPREIEVITSWAPVAPLDNHHPNELLNEASLFEGLAVLDLFHPSKPTIITEMSLDQRLTPAVRDLLQAEQVQTVAIFPQVSLGKWLGCLLVFFSQDKHFEPVELRHIKVLVDQATITLYNLKLLIIEAESRREAERANEIKTEFLAMISHELRTPLTSIIGFTTTLLAEDVTWEPDEQKDFIQTIHKEANRLHELIDHLLVLSRLEAGMLPIALKTHSLNEILEDALPQFQILTRGQTLTLHLPANLPPVNADAKRIAQVLVNLVRNAATYSPKGTEISISANVRGSHMQINVNDQGPGIPQSEHKKVFRAFQRGANMEKVSTPGAGLGLAICKGLIEAHGGRIWIKKKATPGATISFTIPLILVDHPASLVDEER